MSTFRRYQSADYEYSFTNPKPHNYVLAPLNLTSVLKDDHYNINAEIFKLYVNNVIPSLNLVGDDQLYDLTATADITLLQAISRRIHYGKIVAESKFVGPTAAQYTALIKAKDEAGISALLTDAAQEAVVIARATAKASYYGATLDWVNNVLVPGTVKIPPKAVTDLYKNYLIPLTKVVEVHYLMHRLD
ncbi:chorismate mutase [Jimgerdemannia flammicorona]|uniref:Chorismate mutase n=1 Tax=Jimgerdemannia flammicorona TaxID=994334 RepID=A0A433DHI0_9FUNG|nr:chorismate mutase [Jimgerdemannia flammicorona]